MSEKRLRLRFPHSKRLAKPRLETTRMTLLGLRHGRRQHHHGAVARRRGDAHHRARQSGGVRLFSLSPLAGRGWLRVCAARVRGASICAFRLLEEEIMRFPRPARRAGLGGDRARRARRFAGPAHPQPVGRAAGAKVGVGAPLPSLGGKGRARSRKTAGFSPSPTNDPNVTPMMET